MTAISVQGLTKRFGSVAAVDDLSFDVPRGTITGFIGPNGAGKTTTLRMVLGLVRPTGGTALVDGVPYAKLDRPVHHVGAVLEASGFHPGRTAHDHLRVLAGRGGIPVSRVDDVLAEVDLVGAARRRVGGFSLGMKQRLALAGALLGDPGILVLDEPTNGLDPAGVHWLRTFLRGRVDEGCTVLVSSHLLAELALSADSVVIIKGGRLVAQGPVAEIIASGTAAVRVRTPQADQLRAALTARGVHAELDGSDQVVALRRWHRAGRASGRRGRCRRLRDERAASRSRGRLSRADGRRGERVMTALVRAELRQLRSTRSTWALLVVALLFCLTVTAIVLARVGGIDAPPRGSTELRDMLLGASGAGMLPVLLLGVLAVTGEFHHRTATSAFLAVPDRRRVVAAKAIACALLAPVVAVGARDRSSDDRDPFRCHRADVRQRVRPVAGRRTADVRLLGLVGRRPSVRWSATKRSRSRCRCCGSASWRRSFRRSPRCCGLHHGFPARSPAPSAAATRRARCPHGPRWWCSSPTRSSCCWPAPAGSCAWT